MSLYRQHRSTNRNSNLPGQNREESNPVLNRPYNTEPAASGDQNRGTNTAQANREPERLSEQPPIVDEPSGVSTETIPETNEPNDNSNESNRNSTTVRQRIYYPYPNLTWNRERGAASAAAAASTTPGTATTTATSNRQSSNSSSPWAIGMNRFFNNIRDTVVHQQQMNSANDNTDDGDDTDDTDSYHGNNNSTSQNSRSGSGPPRIMRFLNVPSVQVSLIFIPLYFTLYMIYY